jgi:hypothetical protein
LKCILANFLKAATITARVQAEPQEKPTKRFTYPQRDWNKCTGVRCPFGWIHIAGDEKKIVDVEALGDITNAVDARTWSILKTNSRRYSLEALLKVGATLRGNALGYLDPTKFTTAAVEGTFGPANF